MIPPLPRRALALGAFAIATSGTAPGTARAQAWPVKPVRIVVPFPPGGSTDVLARRLAERMSPALGQPVLVENRPGAGGTTGADYVSKSPPDGHTLLMGVTGSNAIAASLFPNLPYDPVAGFSPVSRVVSAPLVVVVNPAMGVNDLAAFVAAAKAAPGAVTYATPGNGTSMHLTGVMFALAAGLDLTHVPYRGSAQAVTDLMAGLVKSSFADLLVILPHLRAGSVKALAVTGDSRHPLLPAVPTVAESGLPGFQAESWQGLFAPPSTSPALLARLHAEVAAAMQAPEIRDAFVAQGFRVEATEPADFARFVKAEVAKWGQVVKEGGVRLD
ncbi:Bug family tripartite tricarboxylate transporter substrate binding protein [Pararoseomonas indoligenes]|uniref:Tripartite tricarboxylate transporter substrate binding protein n=1 Tax=Roseomonas indoligenes TaxID=2820811 RepID=A0A940MWE1_9PROT|nr:tripartite tricarboxylate transporter substrate binding protein [Pararoseomonas indoligenes]MBP0493281.1 tripartite tricarboxylate transporter substrate binding protein [Pararoseomonas indoligenes]